MVRKIINIITTVVLVFLIAVVVLIFIARISGNIPSLFGYHIFRVQSDSMVPTLEVGDVILVQDTPPESIKKGDIITYMCLSGDMEGRTITHRVIEDPEKRNGVYYYITKGDKSGAGVDDEITYDQVEGRYIKTLPWIDKVYTFLLTPVGLIISIGLIVLLFGYEMISLILSYKAIDEKDDDYFEPKRKKPRHKRKKK